MEYFRLGFKILALMGTGATLQEYLSVVGFDDWTAIESRYGAAE